MRSIAAATAATALALGCSAAHAGTLTVSFTNPLFELVDLDPTDGVLPSLTITPTGLPGSSLADWNAPFVLGGEFWLGYSDVVPARSLHLTGMLGVGTGIRWSSSIVVDGSFVGGPAGSFESVMLDGGVGGRAGYHLTAPSILTTFHSPEPLNPLYRYHEELGFGFSLDNTEATSVELEMDLLFRFAYNTDVPRPTPVPEPETYALMLAGLGVMAWVRRRHAGRRER